MTVARCQRTICRPTAVDGFGYFSGRDIRVEFRPAPANAGVTFIRSDLGASARVPASAAYRIDMPRRTTLECDGVRVQMVEHVLAALAGLQVDNCEIWVSAEEMPGCDGSALAFVEAIDAAGVIEQEEAVRQIHVERAIRVGDAHAWIEASRSQHNRLSVAFDFDYEPIPAIGRQAFHLTVNPASFRTELAPCRTFIDEATANRMIERGIGLRVTTQNLLIFGKNGPIENTLRFPDECVRHKVLDVIGDLALTGCEIIADVTACRSGHKLHAELARKLMQQAGIPQKFVAAEQKLCA